MKRDKRAMREAGQGTRGGTWTGSGGERAEVGAKECESDRRKTGPVGPYRCESASKGEEIGPYQAGQEQEIGPCWADNLLRALANIVPYPSPWSPSSSNQQLKTVATATNNDYCQVSSQRHPDRFCPLCWPPLGPLYPWAASCLDPDPLPRSAYLSCDLIFGRSHFYFVSFFFFFFPSRSLFFLVKIKISSSTSTFFSFLLPFLLSLLAFLWYHHLDNSNSTFVIVNLKIFINWPFWFLEMSETPVTPATAPSTSYCDLLTWKDPIKTGKVFGGLVAVLVIFKKVNLFNVFFHLAYIGLLRTYPHCRQIVNEANSSNMLITPLQIKLPLSQFVVPQFFPY